MNFALSRKLIIFALVLPLAAMIGFQLANPYDQQTLLVMAVVTGVLMLPIMLKWYHPLLIFAWNAALNIYFLPGKPQLWMLLSVIGLGIAILNKGMDREKQFIHVPAITLPLLFLLFVMVITAKLRGGVGVRSLGSVTYGGKGYFFIAFAIMGYFALTSKAIPLERVTAYMSGFFLSGTTAAFSNFAYTLGPAFYFLYYLFPVDMAMTQAGADFMLGAVRRFHGVAVAGSAVYFYMMVRFGIRGIFDVTRPWRLPCFLLTIFVGLFGGYRTLLITFIVHFAVQFYFERLVRTRLCLFLLVGGLIAGVLSVPFLDKMPLSVQRCAAFIPGARVSAMAKIDAEGTTQWRLEMWRVMLPQIPQYLILGKGYTLNPSDIYLANQAQLRGLTKNYELAIVAGTYHSGPLSVIVPFGIFGTLGFLWFITAGIWALYRNYRYGDPSLQLVNTFLLAYFVMRILIFLSIFGSLDLEFYRFTGVLGMSMAINRGVRKPAESVRAPADLALQPA